MWWVRRRLGSPKCNPSIIPFPFSGFVENGKGLQNGGDSPGYLDLGSAGATTRDGQPFGGVGSAGAITHSAYSFTLFVLCPILT